jgi:hypothetical protein
MVHDHPLQFLETWDKIVGIILVLGEMSQFFVWLDEKETTPRYNTNGKGCVTMWEDNQNLAD